MGWLFKGATVSYRDLTGLYRCVVKRPGPEWFHRPMQNPHFMSSDLLCRLAASPTLVKAVTWQESARQERRWRLVKKYSIPLWRKEMFLLGTLIRCTTKPVNFQKIAFERTAGEAHWQLHDLSIYILPLCCFFLNLFILLFTRPTPRNVSDVADILPTRLLCLELKWRLLLLAPLSGTNGFHWPGLIPHKSLQRSNHRPGPG